MKKVLSGKYLLLAFLLSAMVACKPGVNKTQVTATYTCSMHPQIRQKTPGTCPLCKMDLVAVNRVHTSLDTLSGFVKSDLSGNSLSAIKTVKPQPGSHFEDLVVHGTINYYGANQHSISARVTGRIEKLYVTYNYQQVVKGEKIMDVYSSDLVNAQQEMLFLKKNAEPVLLEAAKRKLRLLGATDRQIKQVLVSEKINYSVSIYSPFSGYVVDIQSASRENQLSGATETNISAENNESTMAEMPAFTSRATSALQSRVTGPVLLREGQYIQARQKMFELLNTDKVWAEFFVAPEQIRDFKRGYSIKIISVDKPIKQINAFINHIQPFYRKDKKLLLIKAEINNVDKRWKIGQLIDVKLMGKKTDGLWLPREAVVQLGTQFVAFVKQENVFKPVYVQVINRSGNWVNISGSIHKNTEVAANAWFLTDSESFIKVDN